MGERGRRRSPARTAGRTPAATPGQALAWGSPTRPASGSRPRGSASLLGSPVAVVLSWPSDRHRLGVTSTVPGRHLGRVEAESWRRCTSTSTVTPRRPPGPRQATGRSRRRPGWAAPRRADVGADDGRDDREPQARNRRRGPLPARVDPVEPLEDPVGLLGGQPGPVVTDLEHGPQRRRRRTPIAARVPTASSTGVPGGVCRTALAIRFATTWRSRSSSPITTAAHRTAGVEARPAGAGRSGSRPASVVHGVAGEHGQVDRVGAHRPLLVEPGQQQQVLDEAAHPGGLVLDAAHRAGDLVRSRHGALAVQLGEAADAGQRGAQLVRGVGGEPRGCGASDASRARKALSIWASMPFSEAVSRPTSVVRRALRHPLGQVAGGDRGRGVLHLAQRPERPPDREPAEQHAGRGHGRARTAGSAAAGVSTARSTPVSVLGHRDGRLPRTPFLGEVAAATADDPPAAAVVAVPRRRPSRSVRPARPGELREQGPGRRRRAPTADRARCRWPSWRWICGAQTTGR